MFTFIESILVKIISLLPDADPNNSVITAVTNAFATMAPTFSQIDLVFPIFVLFKVLLLVMFVEMTIFLFTFILQIATFFKP
ncbi:MAG: hypothetical protein GW939_04330 [Candidatus Magasanikbacteria bacterium]|uniref:Uncharacterized protein n=1 Tax=Candidatus Magasanikbacteria bacterium CG10_big_fil_rev_8_21_14_0_10_38_6 TaxID=1974647 RepID=A0A2M6P1I9_9BACT|nr:hypothetical protein [Candidatus Magasanikbacteria bacterium]PIR77419.1 MAG: hypothetical protein COU30_02545 [Candidatus Magasanikbacteria bacterium CG10_big_fil_rev_8_21_14_0_10_38_6]